MIQQHQNLSRIVHVKCYPNSPYHALSLIQTQARGPAHADLQGCHENVLASKPDIMMSRVNCKIFDIW